MADPRYHRHLLFGKADQRLERALGRPLHHHERQSRFDAPHLQALNMLEAAIARRRGGTFLIYSARQTGKGEIEGFASHRALLAYRHVPGSTWVRVAPVWKPQIVISMNRAAKHHDADPFTRGRWRRSRGYIHQLGQAGLEFFTAAPSASVVGGTASLVLSGDEGHKLDPDKFLEDFGPFTASTDAPTVLYGVCAWKRDLMHHLEAEALKLGRVLKFPASLWCELSPAYRRHYDERVATLGASHPIIRTQYDLEHLDSVGGFLDPLQVASLCGGDHPRLLAPRPGCRYLVLVDLGGEDEHEQQLGADAAASAGRDSTVVLVVELDQGDDGVPFPQARVVNAAWWTGAEHMAILDQLQAFVRYWGVEGGVIDARGVGEAVAMTLQRRLPMLEAYKATAATASIDCYDLLARINAGAVRLWRGDPAGDAELRELQAQAGHAQKRVTGVDQLNIGKPVGLGTANLHVDGLKALTYLGRALGGRRKGSALSYIRQATDALRAEREEGAPT